MEGAFDRITHIPGLLGGRATIRGLRVSVAHVVNLVANGMTPEQIVGDLPELDVEGCPASARLRRGSGQG